MPLPYPPKAPESATTFTTTPQTLILPNAPLPTLADPSQLFPNATFSSQPPPFAPQELPSDPSTTAYRPATLNLTLLTDLSTVEPPKMPSAAAAAPSVPSPDELSAARQLAMWAETPQLPTATGPGGMILPDALPRVTLPATTSYGYYQPPLVGATTTFHGLWQCQPPILNTMTCTPSAPIMSLLPPAYPPSRGVQASNGFQGYIPGAVQISMSGQSQEYFTQHNITKEQNNAATLKGMIKPESRDDPSPESDVASDDVVLMNLDTGNLVRDRQLQPSQRLECEQCPFGAADEMALRMHYAQYHYVQDHNRVKETIMKYSP